MNNSLETKWLHIPLEIVERELNPKALLAAEAVQKGWSCVIGTKKSVLAAADQLPTGLVYLKSVIPSEYENMLRYKDFGHRLVCLDEEGLIQSSLETLAKARYNEKTVALAEKFYCWGQTQCSYLQNYYPDSAHKFSVTGSPTADLWTLKSTDLYKDDIRRIQERFGNYILIPSSFAVVNHFMGRSESLNIMKRDNMYRDEAHEAYYKGYHDYVEKVFDAFLEFIPVLSREFSDRAIILRPHPSDDHKCWHDVTAPFENIHVVFEGPVSPWLAGADAILHWGSTTGLEAYLLGRPVVGYTPVPDEEKKYDVLPHLVSIMRHKEDEVVEVLKDILNKPEGWKDRYTSVLNGHEELKTWIRNLEQGPAYSNLIQAFEELNLAPQSFEDVSVQAPSLSYKEALWRTLELFNHIPFIERVWSERIKIGLSSRAYGRHKTSFMRKDVVEAAFRNLGYDNLDICQLDEGLFSVSKT